MVFADEENYDFSKTELENLKQEVTNLKLDDYIRFNEDNCPITVYGGVITKFIF